MRITPLALAAGLLFGGGDSRAQGADAAAALEPSRRLQPPLRGEAARRAPIVLRARELRARPDLEAVAEGDVEFRRAGTVIHADRLSYEQAEDLAVARGNVRIEREGAVYSGPELQLHVQRFEGFFLEPRFEFLTIGAGGRADRIDFLDAARAVATNTMYTSCPRDGSGDPAWVLEARRVQLDLDANEGVAQGAVLRFLGVPILAAPSLSFPLTDERKSGWLPPSINIDSRSGIELGVPYYWNIAPNRDATLTPRVITRRGFAMDGEFRYLEPSLEGVVRVNLLPDDRLAERSREAVQWRHDGSGPAGLRYGADVVRVSDDGWWKDFPDSGRSLTPRLLLGRGYAEREFAAGGGSGLAYARLVRWQVLQGADSLVTPPYERSPQLGVRWGSVLPGGLEAGIETELNRFVLPSGDPVVLLPGGGVAPSRPQGNRFHVLGAISRPWREPGWWVLPKLSFNAASYDIDDPGAGRRDASRVIPTASVDMGLEFERSTIGFGRALRQTLEPRLLYANTPYKQQARFPNFDSAAKDFNVSSLYSENAFSGVDRVSDAHQVSAGVTSRMIDEADGAEVLRAGFVQRVLLRDQRIAPGADGTPDGPPLEQRYSDVLLFASTAVIPRWTLDGSLQYSPELSRSVRSIIGGRYSPGPFRTVSAAYRFARGLSEQVELGWQWPVFTRAAPAGSACRGTLYTVGRVNYSMKDSRVTDSILGAEYDAGCWIGRIVAERLSTGRSEATTRLLLQLELVGLSRLGANPLKVLKENVPGYSLLREERRPQTPPDE